MWAVYVIDTNSIVPQMSASTLASYTPSGVLFLLTISVHLTGNFVLKGPSAAGRKLSALTFRLSRALLFHILKHRTTQACQPSVPTRLARTVQKLAYLETSMLVALN